MGLEDDLRDASGDVATIKKLLTERADVNSKDSGVRNLFVSCLQILPPCFPHSQHMRFATCVQGLACISGTQCGVDEGDCDSDNDCASGLQCGYNNCAWGDHANGQYEVGTNDCCSDADFRELCQCVGGFDHGQRCTQDPLEIGGMYWCYLSPETIATCPDQRISPEWGDYTPWSELACGGRGSGAADLALNIGVVVMVAAAALF